MELFVLPDWQQMIHNKHSLYVLAKWWLMFARSFLMYMCLKGLYSEAAVCQHFVFMYQTGQCLIKAKVGNVEETSKSKLGFKSIRPSLQAFLQSYSPKTHKHALPDYCWRTSPVSAGSECAQVGRCAGVQVDRQVARPIISFGPNEAFFVASVWTDCNIT